MAALERELRRTLERTIREARVSAEEAVRESVTRLGVGDASAPEHLSEDDRALRRSLRAHSRRLGDRVPREESVTDLPKLVEAAAYVRWHRLLFARFLAERGLLRHPDEPDLSLSLADCADLARDEGLADAYALAAHYAARWLPAVFDDGDPACRLELAPEHEAALRSLVEGLPTPVFTASDSLGWTYQYWRAAEKDAVNASGRKIGRDELPAVTQLFTEPYMVRFLLHNTLGAWWAGKRIAAEPELARLPDEPSLRAALALPGADWEYLRFVREGEDGSWRPAAGDFPGWPSEAAQLTVLDPCCGSGHFLTEALPILTALRQAEDYDLSPARAVAAVLHDNLFGLELDGRCVQIAAFATALAAWEVGGWQALPNPHIAWVGAPPPLPRAEFEALGNGDPLLRQALGALYDLFRQAPLLGSLIEVKGGDLVARADLHGVEEAMERLAARAAADQPERVEGAVAARGMADAAALLARKWVLQVTNVPYLGRGKQNADLKTHLDGQFDEAKADLATAMLVRMLRGADAGGSVAAVTPQNWLFLTSYKRLRERLLAEKSLDLVVGLGSRAFEAISGEVVNAALVAWTNLVPAPGTAAAGLDANDGRDPAEKERDLLEGALCQVKQEAQRNSPDSRISTEVPASGPLLSAYASGYQGISPADFPRYGRCFWEGWSDPNFRYWQSTVSETQPFAGRELVLWFGDDLVRAARNGQAYIRGEEAWNRAGVAVSQMSSLQCTLYTGEAFDTNCAAIVPHSDEHLLPVWAYCSSDEFAGAVRRVDRKVNVTNATLVKVPFDLDRWRRVAAERYPNGLPQPYSDNPTQWLFHGHPARTEEGMALHVALARLSGYRWPAESDPEMRLSAEARDWIARAAELPDGDRDGILAMTPVAGERPLAERLRGYLAASFGPEWSHDLEMRLVAEADARFERSRVRDPSLEAWLRDRALRQHCKLFHDRPFLWQVWDGRGDGFSAFVHYHRLDRRALERLTYTVIGDYVTRAEADTDAGRAEAAKVLQAKLRLILEGEAPYDIFVRWKALECQPLGWEPDLDDGVRMNIRPFIMAGLLRAEPNIHWKKDRGTDVRSAPWFPVHNGERINDHHTTLAEKRAARAEAEAKLAEAKAAE